MTACESWDSWQLQGEEGDGPREAVEDEQPGKETGEEK